MPGLGAGARRVRDVYARRDLGTFAGSYAARVPAHDRDVAFLVLV